jgi:hypothetical protein
MLDIVPMASANVEYLAWLPLHAPTHTKWNTLRNNSNSVELTSEFNIYSYLEKLSAESILTGACVRDIADVTFPCISKGSGISLRYQQWEKFYDFFCRTDCTWYFCCIETSSFLNFFDAPFKLYCRVNLKN